MSDTTNLLLPEPSNEHDLFICDVSDAVIKDVMAQMEHPFFSLSKTPDMIPRIYEHGGKRISVLPSFRGLATIYDKDILIYCISQIMAKLNRGEPVSKRVRINTYELLTFTQRGTSGRDYMELRKALQRIGGTKIETNIMTGDIEQTESFGLVESFLIQRSNGSDGRLLLCEVTLSDWVFNAIREQEVLTLHRDYFQLTKSIERRIYEIARKHCGVQPSWKITVEGLHKKAGSRGDLKNFRRSLRALISSNHLPDYTVAYDEASDCIAFSSRGTIKTVEDLIEPWSGSLDPSIYDQMREVAPGWDVRVIEYEWRLWLGENEIAPKHPERHLLKFCSGWVERNQKVPGA